MLTETESARDHDHNGFMTIRDNPITRSGVFQYRGSSLPGADPDRIYNVYRPIEELDNLATLESFKGLPIVDEHEMLGDRYERGPEERGVHGSILESIAIKGRDVVANLRIWSRTLKSLIDSGKKGLSLGYNCTWEKTSGVFEGTPYNYIQRNIRGNHLALVNQGRCGTAVLDQYDAMDHFDLALDTGELNMADKETKPEDKATEKGEPTISEIMAMLAPMTEFMTKVQEFMTAAGAKADSDLALDADSEKKDDDKAEDADKDADKDDEKKDDKKDDKAMDKKDIEHAMDSKIAAFSKTSMKSHMAAVAKRDELAKALTPHVGTFDYSAMDVDDVAKYGCDKLELAPEAGQERGVLSGFLKGAKKDTTTFALDSAVTKLKPDSKAAGRLASASA